MFPSVGNTSNTIAMLNRRCDCNMYVVLVAVREHANLQTSLTASSGLEEQPQHIPQ